MRVDYEGSVTADKTACLACSIDVDHVNRTIKILGLNVKRLQRARKERLRALNDNYGDLFKKPSELFAMIWHLRNLVVTQKWKAHWCLILAFSGVPKDTEVIDTEVMQKAARVMKKAARMELLPGEDGRLPRFFTTSRSYFYPVAEEILAEAPQDWI